MTALQTLTSLGYRVVPKRPSGIIVTRPGEALPSPEGPAYSLHFDGPEDDAATAALRWLNSNALEAPLTVQEVRL